MPDEQTPWVVKGVPGYVRKKVKLYAVEHDLTMAKAIETLVETALSREHDKNKPQEPPSSRPVPAQEHIADNLLREESSAGSWSPDWFRLLSMIDKDAADTAYRFAREHHLSLGEAFTGLLRLTVKTAEANARLMHEETSQAALEATQREPSQKRVRVEGPSQN
jgi:hypothetical protein